MTQRQIELRQSYLKVLKNKRNRVLSKEQKDKVKRNLLKCYERARSPVCNKRSGTPLSFRAHMPGTECVFFLAYRFDQYAKGFKCSDCFVKSTYNSDTFTAEQVKELLEKYSVYWEITLSQFYKNLDSLSRYKCEKCDKALAIVRPYDSAHLDFE